LVRQVGVRRMRVPLLVLPGLQGLQKAQYMHDSSKDVRVKV
jgi:hypothetical protein